MDWKDQLSRLQASMPEEEETPVSPAPESPADGKKKFHGRVRIFFEKKGRGGKSATILEPESLDEAAIDELARLLKSRLAVGGSARGGEILLQGDLRERVRPALRSLGFSV